MDKKLARQRLAKLWFIASGFLLLLFVIYTATNRFDNHNAEGWQWYTQSIFPSLTLISAFYFTAHPDDLNLLIDEFAFRLAYGISAGYLAVIILTVLLAPLSFKYAHLSILETFHQSQLYLTIFQGLVTASIGWLFGKAKAKKASRHG